MRIYVSEFLPPSHLYPRFPSSRFLSKWQNALDIFCGKFKFLETVGQCWTIGAIFTFGRSRMLGHDKLWPLVVGRS